MAELPTNTPTTKTAQIPIEIISDEEMALTEAAMSMAVASARSIIPFNPFVENVRSVHSISLLAKRGFSSCNQRKSESDVCDIEESAGSECSRNKRNKVRDSFLNRFRRKRGLGVTDVTGADWCEKQMEYNLELGKPKPSKAMQAGIARHAELENKVSRKVKVHLESYEDVWALKFLNFILCSNQLIFDGLTREVPIVSFEKGVWMVGVIDEIRISVIDTERYSTLVDTKTRNKAKLPAEPQQRNGRLQLMCYKRMWDSLVANKFPIDRFYNAFPLNRYQTLSANIREHAAESGIPAENLNDLIAHFRNACCVLPPAHNELLLRYEFQEDQSLIGEDKFGYDGEWLSRKLAFSLEFWHGERDPTYPPMEERWKCNSCKFFSKCRPSANVVECSTSEEVA